MPLQNRVDPTGQLIFTSARGRLMGNRGKLHNAKKEVVRPWEKKAWIICETQFKGIQRVVFGAGTYSELFFLDEATALSAGHRPCSDCQKPRLLEFKSLWRRVNPSAEPIDALPAIRVPQIDEQLHAERIDANGGKVTFDCVYRDVPDGVFVVVEGQPHLRWKGRLLRWTPEGYVSPAVNLTDDEAVKVLTPPSIVRMVALGFTPKVHASAEVN